MQSFRRYPICEVYSVAEEFRFVNITHLPSSFSESPVFALRRRQVGQTRTFEGVRSN